MIFDGLKKIPVKKKKRPGMQSWYDKMTPWQRDYHRKLISEGTKKYYDNRPEEIAKKKSESMRLNKIVFYATPAGRIEKEYKAYLGREYQLGLEGEERKRVLAKRNAGIKKAWAKRMAVLFEKDVPRKKTYCGVVREERMYG